MPSAPGGVVPQARDKVVVSCRNPDRMIVRIRDQETACLAKLGRCLLAYANSNQRGLLAKI